MNRKIIDEMIKKYIIKANYYSNFSLDKNNINQKITVPKYTTNILYYIHYALDKHYLLIIIIIYTRRSRHKNNKKNEETDKNNCKKRKSRHNNYSKIWVINMEVKATIYQRKIFSQLLHRDHSREYLQTTIYRCDRGVSVLKLATSREVLRSSTINKPNRFNTT